MTKSELIDTIALQTPELQRRDVELMVNTVLKTIGEALVDGRRVEIRGFGSFITKLRCARTGRNPRTGEKVKISKKYVPFFSMGKELYERLNNHSPARAVYVEKQAPWL